MRNSNGILGIGSAAMIALGLGLGLGLGASAMAQPCEVPDNGNGTVNLPPEGCGYVSPEDLHLIIDGLPPGTTIEVAAEHSKFFQVIRQPGGVFGPDGEVETFQSLLFMEMTGTGELAGFNRFVVVQLGCEVHTGPRNEGDQVQTFPNDMMFLQGQLAGDPDFDFLRIAAGTGLGLPGPGGTTLTDLDNGLFNVDSFFDLEYEIEFVGAPGSILEGLAGITRETVRMQAGETVEVDECAFREDFDSYPDGSIIVPQGGWEPWNGDPNFQNGIVTSAVAFTNPHSLEIDGTDDIVHQHSGVTSGRWRYETWQFIPDGFTGQSYFILLNRYFPSQNADWSTQIVADSTTGQMMDFNGPGTVPLVTGSWASISVQIDLDHDVQRVFYDDQLLFEDTWTNHVDSGGALEVAAVDLFASGATRVFYDELTLCPDPDPCPEDLDGSGAVDFGDILAVLADWGPYAPCPPYKFEDLSQNCNVDFSDILLILAKWGPCGECLEPDVDPFTTFSEDDTITQVEFGSPVIPPLPADFFGPGSDPFDGQVPLAGFVDDNLVDTKVRRAGPLHFPGQGFPRPSDPVPVEIVELSLTGVEPFVVTSNGGQDPELWLAAMGLSDNQERGVLRAVIESPEGGATDAIVPVKPRLVFAPEQDLQLLAEGVITPDEVQLRILDWDQEGLPPVDMGWEDPFPFSTVPPSAGFFNACELDNPFPFFPGVPPGGGLHGGDGEADAPGLPPHIAAGGPGHLHYVCPPPPPPPGLCLYRRLGVTRCFFGGGGGQCPAPPAGKLFLRCPVGPCAPVCPRFIIVIFPCQPPGTGFCIGFYRCVRCTRC